MYRQMGLFKPCWKAAIPRTHSFHLIGNESFWTKRITSRIPKPAYQQLAADLKQSVVGASPGVSSMTSEKLHRLEYYLFRWLTTFDSILSAPIQNSLQDVYGLLKFLRHEPWCEVGFWRNAITNALTGVSTGNEGDASESNSNVERSDAMSIAFGRVRRVLAPIILRRTKDTLTKEG